MQVGIGFDVLGLRGIDEAQEFMDLETLRRLGEKGFELGGGFGEVACVVLSDGGLEFLVQELGFGVALLSAKR